MEDSIMEFCIKNTQVYGLDKSMIASGNSYRTVMDDNDKEATEKDISRAVRLSSTGLGEGHDQFLTGVVVEFDLYAPLYMWKEIQRYKFMNFVSSQSTMHCLSKFKLTDKCTKETDQRVIDICQELIDEYNQMVEANKTNQGTYKEENIKKVWRKMIASLPCGFVLGATMVTNYRQLRGIYKQRKDHRLDEWHEFCDWIETLPYSNLIVNTK